MLNTPSLSSLFSKRHSSIFNIALIAMLLMYSSASYSGYRTFLDPRSMSMGGTGVAAATKFNASYHNPALIAFNRGEKPDKIYISSSVGVRETYDYDIEGDLEKLEDAADLGQNRFAATAQALDLNSYRSDETSAFNLLVDTRPVTINFYTRQDIREMTTIRGNTPNVLAPASVTVQDTYFELSEFGVTVATTDVVDYNMPISWGYTAKLFEIRGSHIATPFLDYDLNDRPPSEVSNDFLEWNFDIGFAMLLTDEFLYDKFGLDGWWTEGEWVVAVTSMNILPTDFTPFRVGLGNSTFVGEKRSIQALYQIGIAHYRQDYMFTIDLDVEEREVFDFEGVTRFLSVGGEYFWRKDFHLRAGFRVNTGDPDGAGQDGALLTGGFIYYPRHLSIEAGFVASDVEVGGTFGIGLSF